MARESMSVGGFVWALEGDTPAPSLPVPPMTRIEVLLVTSGDVFHAFHVDGVGASPAQDARMTVSFISPAQGSARFECPVHPSTMNGRFEVDTNAGTGATSGAAIATPPLTPDVGPATQFVLEGHQAAARYSFLSPESPQHNPALAVPADAAVEITLRVVSGVHNLRVGLENATARTAILTEGEEATLSFVAPANGFLEYWCDPHKSAGMRGRISVGEAPPLIERALPPGSLEDTVPAGAMAQWTNTGSTSLSVDVTYSTGTLSQTVAPRESLLVAVGSAGDLLLTASEPGRTWRQLVHVAA